MLWLVDAGRNGPHAHRLGRERPHQVTRVRFLSKPADVVAWCEDNWHPVMDVRDKLVGVRRDDGERASPLAGSGLLPVLPDTSETKWGAILHRDRVGLLGPLPLDGLPLEEAVHRHDTAPYAIGIPETGQVSRGLALSVDGLAAASRVTAPVRDEAPTQRVERHLAVPMVAADNQQFLAGRGVPARREVVHAAVAHVHAIDNGVPQRSTALDDSPAHGPGCNRE